MYHYSVPTAAIETLKDSGNENCFLERQWSQAASTT